VLQALKKIDPKFPDLKPEIQQQLQQFQKIIQMVNINEIKDLKEALEKKK
jgi:molybdopterin converting factor small subunit